MKTLALVSQKGGSGKTTLALNLAIAATLARKVVAIIDLDPQQSAARWARLRTDEQPVILPGHGPNLPDLVKRAMDGGADVVIIDTAPKSENASLLAARLADLVLIPCQPSNLDLDAVADSVNIASLAKVKAAFVLNNCRSSSGLADDAAEALAGYGLPLAPVRIGSRVAFVKSLTEGKGVLEYEPKGSAAQEVQALAAFARAQGGM
jgi:chromosome partitioning protein